MKRINAALISVYHKEGLLPLLRMMDALKIKIYSTGGTCDYIKAQGFEVVPVEEMTGYPSILGGRVKTLHPAVMGGILHRREHGGDLQECMNYQIPPIDLVVVDLYPFKEAVASGQPEEDIIEKIDIGGISLIRAAAKNHRDVLVIPERSCYAVLESVLQNQGETDLALRREMAGVAFEISSGYDMAISDYFNCHGETSPLKINICRSRALRYGENPHQRGFYYGQLEGVFDQLHGKEISYNNLLDIDAAVKLMAEFEEPSVAILKHNNACGLASGDELKNVWPLALQGDPISAYGGVVIVNRQVDVATGEQINKIFFEVIIAPGFDEDALDLLRSKKNRIILKLKDSFAMSMPMRSVLNGYLVQDADLVNAGVEEVQIVTKHAPNPAEMEDLLFANKIVKHTKSNAIVLVKNKQLIGSGTGQTSRVDAMKQAIAKARSFELPLEGAVVASDAFFPFADNVEEAFKAGIRAVIQPGGSVRDRDSIDFCDAHNMSMVFTGKRHFKH